MNTSIKIQYFGTMRLLFHKKEEVLHIDGPVTFAEIIVFIDRKYGHDFQNKANHLMFIYYSRDEVESCQLRFPRDKDTDIKKHSTIKILNAMTLG